HRLHAQWDLLLGTPDFRRRGRQHPCHFCGCVLVHTNRRRSDPLSSFFLGDRLHPHSDSALGIHTWNKNQGEEGRCFGDSKSTRPSAHGHKVGRSRFCQGQEGKP